MFAEKATETLIIEGVLIDTEIGQVVTYEDLSKRLGRDVREFCRGNIRTATKALQDQGVFFHVVRGVGLKRVDHEEALEGIDSGVSRIRNAARRTARRMSAIDFGSLSEEGKKKHLVSSAQLGAIHMFSTTRARKRIESKVSKGADELPVGKVLEMFT